MAPALRCWGGILGVVDLLWLFVLRISSNPSLSYALFSACICEIIRVVFTFANNIVETHITVNGEKCFGLN
jgi:hypothetical protein